MGWGTVVSCDVACHVMSFDAMWLLVLCHVTWWNAMPCDVRSCDELSSVVPCNVMECYELVMPLVVGSRCVVRSGSVRQCGDPKNYSVLPSTTLYYKVLLCTTKYILRTTKHYSVLQSTTPYYKVLLCTTKFTWNVQYNARSNRNHPPTSPDIAPATKRNLMIDPRPI